MGSSTAWLCLVIAGLLEIGFASAIKLMDGHKTGTLSYRLNERLVAIRHKSAPIAPLVQLVFKVPAAFDNGLS